jgi:CheY-like chemotaxis protein
MPERVPMAEDPAGAANRVVLVVQEISERVLTTRHLRESGFDVVEAADGDEARRVLDARRVDVVFADFDMPGKTDGLGLLRVLRERHPATKTILTSGADTDMSAVEGYGIFLSKPYRMVDLDHCLQRLLVDANGSLRPAGPARQADRAASAVPPSNAPVGNGASRRWPIFGRVDGHGDDVSEEWSVELARQLADRAARQQAVEPGAAKAARRAAMQAYDLARARRLRLIAGFALGAGIAVAIAGIGPMVGWWPDPLADARIEAAASVETATAKLASILPDPKPSSPAPKSQSSTTGVPDGPLAQPGENPPTSTEVAQSTPAAPDATPPSPTAQPEIAAPAQPSLATKTEPVGQATPVELAANQTPPLDREEVREIQTRLRWFGFNPGPIDGATGARTTGAVMRYQQARGDSQTGTVDRDLLTQLREDPAPQAPQPAARPEYRASRPRGTDPFEPVRAAAERFDRWMQSVLR